MSVTGGQLAETLDSLETLMVSLMHQALAAIDVDASEEEARRMLGRIGCRIALGKEHYDPVILKRLREGTL